MTFHDVIVVGAGPSGCAAALGFAKSGLSVCVLEAEPHRGMRFGIEWLHPTAIELLAELGLDIRKEASLGRGWALLPEDGSEALLFPYPRGSDAAALPQEVLMSRLRRALGAHPRITYLEGARAVQQEGVRLRFAQRVKSFPEEIEELRGDLIVGASGRSGNRWSPESPSPPAPCSRLVAIRLNTDQKLPFEGFYHIVLGGLGPLVFYRLDSQSIRILIDVPLAFPLPREGTRLREAMLEEAYRSMLPLSLRPLFREALLSGNYEVTMNAVRAREWPRVAGRPNQVAWIGDALGVQHPLSALGLVLALGDARALWRGEGLGARMRASRVPEMIAIALYEAFADSSPSTAAIRSSVIRMLRTHHRRRLRIMSLVSGQNQSRADFARTAIAMLLHGGRDLLRWGIRTGRIDEVPEIATEIAGRLGWLAGGTFRLTQALPVKNHQEAPFGPALRASRPSGEVLGLGLATPLEIDLESQIETTATRLLALQRPNGAIRSQFTLRAEAIAIYLGAMRALSAPVPPETRAHLRTFIEMNLDRLRVLPPTARLLLYIGARWLGIEADDPRLLPLRVQARFPPWVLTIFAASGLIDWQILEPKLPGFFFSPSSSPLAEKAGALLRQMRFQAPPCPITQTIRKEIEGLLDLSPTQLRLVPSLPSREAISLELANIDQKLFQSIGWADGILLALALRAIAPSDPLLNRVALSLSLGAPQGPNFPLVFESELRESALALIGFSTLPIPYRHRFASSIDRLALFLRDFLEPSKESSQTLNKSLKALCLLALLNARSIEMHEAEKLLESIFFDEKDAFAPDFFSRLFTPTSSFLEGWHLLGPLGQTDEWLFVSVAGLGQAIECFPELRPKLLPLLERGLALLRGKEKPMGNWPVGGHRLFGTMLGIYALRSASCPPHDSAIRRACASVHSMQESDGSWAIQEGSSPLADTAYALLALLLGEDFDLSAIERAFRFMLGTIEEAAEIPALFPGLGWGQSAFDLKMAWLWALSLFAKRKSN
ncbi:MAG: FAD-dependent monooxygenase [Sandaracinaceae bacterium]|nr:FAD-dependent monooxygenase [Sandaracinaceae bacterium]